MEDELLEKLRLIYESSHEHYAEATFERPGRIVDRAFRWAAIYTFVIALVPAFFQTVVSSVGFDFGTNNTFCAFVKIVLGGISILFLGAALFKLFQTLRYRRYEWIRVEDLARIGGTVSLALFYTTVIEKYESLKTRNHDLSETALQRLALSNAWFYWALMLGVLFIYGVNGLFGTISYERIYSIKTETI